MCHDDDLAAQLVVLAEDFLRQHFQEIQLRRRRSRNGDAIGRAEVGKGAQFRPIGEQHRRQCGQAGNRHDLLRRILCLLPCSKQRREAERRDIDCARAHRFLQRSGAEEALVAHLDVKVSLLGALLDELHILADVGGKKRQPEPQADPHGFLRRRRRGEQAQRQERGENAQRFASEMMRHQPIFSSAIGLRSTPMCSISTSHTSPSFIHTGGLRANPTPEGVPVNIMSPGSSVMPCVT